LHAFPLFIGQFLPLFLHAGSSAAKAVAQIKAAKNEKITLLHFLIRLICHPVALTPAEECSGSLNFVTANNGAFPGLAASMTQ